MKQLSSDLILHSGSLTVRTNVVPTGSRVVGTVPTDTIPDGEIPGLSLGMAVGILVGVKPTTILAIVGFMAI